MADCDHVELFAKYGGDFAPVSCPYCTKAQTREYITFHTTPDVNGPSVDLMHGKKQRIVVFAQLAEPQPAGLPPGMVAIVLPPNCYIDTAQE